MPPSPLFRFAGIYLLATAIFYVSSRLAAGDILDSTGTAAALVVAIASFGILLASMWLLYKAVPLPGMLCCVLAVTILGVAASLDVGVFDTGLGRRQASELTVHLFMVGVVLLVVAVLLMPNSVVNYLRTVVIPALLGRRKP